MHYDKVYFVHSEYNSEQIMVVIYYIYPSETELERNGFEKQLGNPFGVSELGGWGNAS